MLYVFGYGKNWWKNDGKLLIFIMCLQKRKRKKKRYKVTLWKEKKWKVEKKNEKPKKYIMKKVVAKIRMKEDEPKRYMCQVMCSTSLLDSLLYILVSFHS